MVQRRPAIENEIEAQRQVVDALDRIGDQIETLNANIDRIILAIHGSREKKIGP